MDTLIINHAYIQDIDDILSLRSTTNIGDLKTLSRDEIYTHIHEFFLVYTNTRIVGCFRIFIPESSPDVLELGSVVSIMRGVGNQIASFAEEIARNRQKPIIAITGGKYDRTLEKHRWQLATEHFEERMTESCLDKKLWIYPKL